MKKEELGMYKLGEIFGASLILLVCGLWLVMGLSDVAVGDACPDCDGMQWIDCDMTDPGCPGCHDYMALNSTALKAMGAGFQACKVGDVGLCQLDGYTYCLAEYRCKTDTLTNFLVCGGGGNCVYDGDGLTSCAEVNATFIQHLGKNSDYVCNN